MRLADQPSVEVDVLVAAPPDVVWSLVADVKLSTRRSGLPRDVARAFNDMMDLTNRFNRDLGRVSREARAQSIREVRSVLRAWPLTPTSDLSLDVVGPSGTTTDVPAEVWRPTFTARLADGSITTRRARVWSTQIG